MNNMHTYLPQQQKHELRKEYIFRLLVTFGSAMLIVIICTIIFMLPAYFDSYVQKNQTSDLLTKKTNSKLTTNVDEVSAKVKAVTTTINLFSDGLQRPSIVNVVNIAYDSLVPGIKLKGFEIVYVATSTAEMRLSGEASTRDTLISYRKKIEGNGMVAKVELPVSDLAKSKELTFLMKIVSK